jgi:undecaprenyl-diphosphatase
MINFFNAAILGVVEGVTEFLPISSTGHLILSAKLLALPATEFWKSFEIFIQLGAILAVVVIYWRRLWERTIIKKLIVAFVPTAVLGLIFYKFIKHYLLGNLSVVIWSMLIGGVILVAFEWWYKRRSGLKDVVGQLISPIDYETADVGISYRQALIIGLCQSVAMVPGVSRSAATIIGGLALGLKRRTIVEFSFLLAVPTMAAATGLDLFKNVVTFQASDFSLLAIGFVGSFFTALLVIKWLLAFIQKYSFTIFGIYRIIAAIIFWKFFL